jgi:hypothetical protein
MAPGHFLSLPDAPEISWLGPHPSATFNLKSTTQNIIHPSFCRTTPTSDTTTVVLAYWALVLALSLAKRASLPSSLRNNDIDISTRIPDTNGRMVPGALERSALCDWRGKKCECHSLVPPVRVVGPFRDGRDEVPLGPSQRHGGRDKAWIPTVRLYWVLDGGMSWAHRQNPQVAKDPFHPSGAVKPFELPSVRVDWTIDSEHPAAELAAAESL